MGKVIISLFNHFFRNRVLLAWKDFALIVSPSTIDKMFEIYTFSKIRPKFEISSKIRPKFTLFSKIGSKFILAFCSKIGPKFCQW